MYSRILTSLFARRAHNTAPEFPGWAKRVVIGMGCAVLVLAVVLTVVR